MKRIRTMGVWLAATLTAAALIGAASASAASTIAFRGKSARTYAVREHACTVARPTGVQPGDEMLMLVYVEDPENRGAFTISGSGWSVVEKIENHSSGFPFALAVLAKRFEASDPGEYSFAWSGTSKRGCGVLGAAWSGVSASEPINAHLGAASKGASSTVVGPSITTTKANSMVVMLGDYNGPDTRTAPAGMEDVAGPEGVIAQLLQPSAGPTGDKDAKTHSTNGNVGFLVGLTPEGSGPPPPLPPTVGGVSPSSGTSAGGTSVTIAGTNLSGASAVKFGASSAASIKVNSATSITATSPAGSGTVDVTVTTSAGTSSTSSADRFTYEASKAAIAFRGKSARTYAVREHACTVARPTGVQPGDEMLMLVYVEDPENRGAFTISGSGWSVVEKIENHSSGFPFALAVLAKRFEASDPGEYSFAWSGTSKRGCGVLGAAWSGVSASEPINAHLGAASKGASSTVVGPSITTTKANSMVVMLGDYNGPDTRTAPAGMEDVAGPEGVIAQLLQPSAGPTGDKDAKTHSTNGNVGFLVGLTPEGE